jgi:outer membrane protein assembly factor BamD (BamD/ComL family)
MAGQPGEWTYGPEGWQAAADAERVGRPDAAAMADLLRPPQMDAPAFDPVFDPIVARLGQGDARGAFRRTVDWLRANAGDPRYDQALFLAARSLFVRGDRVKAFFYCDQLLDEFPQSELWDDTLMLQYDIADAYLDGYEQRLLGFIPSGNQDGDAIEMLFRLRERAPGSVLSERALLRTGDHFYDNGDYELAADVYLSYNNQYARSPIGPSVRLREALANLRQFQGPEYDLAPLLDARARLLDLQATDADFAAARGVATLLVDIERQMAQKLLVTGAYWERVDEDAAAARSYQQVLDRHGELPEAEEARQRLAGLGVEVADAE